MIKIVTTIEECFVTAMQFSNTEMFVEYQLGSPELIVSLPYLRLEPDCGVNIDLTRSTVTSIFEPSGATYGSLIELNLAAKTVKVKKTSEPALVNESLIVVINFQTDEGLKASLVLTVDFVIDGPFFLKQNLDGSPIKRIPLTCSKLDASWSYQLPSVEFSEVQTVTIAFP